MQNIDKISMAQNLRLATIKYSCYVTLYKKNIGKGFSSGYWIPNRIAIYNVYFEPEKVNEKFLFYFFCFDEFCLENVTFCLK